MTPTSEDLGDVEGGGREGIRIIDQPNNEALASPVRSLSKSA